MHAAGRKGGCAGISAYIYSVAGTDDKHILQAGVTMKYSEGVLPDTGSADLGWHAGWQPGFLLIPHSILNIHQTESQNLTQRRKTPSNHMRTLIIYIHAATYSMNIIMWYLVFLIWLTGCIILIQNPFNWLKVKIRYFFKYAAHNLFMRTQWSYLTQNREWLFLPSSTHLTTEMSLMSVTLCHC